MDAVGEDAPYQLKHDERHPLRETEIGEMERIAADRPHLPGERHVLGAVPKHVTDDAGPVETIVPGAESSKRRAWRRCLSIGAGHRLRTSDGGGTYALPAAGRTQR